MSEQKELFPGKEVRISWSHSILVKVPEGSTPQEVWEVIQLGKLDEEKARGVILDHEMYDCSTTFYDDAANEQIDEDEKI